MSENYAIVAERAGHCCEYCRAPEAAFNIPFEIEPIQPRALGGASSLENSALSCRSCNLFKSDFIAAKDGFQAKWLAFSIRDSIAGMTISALDRTVRLSHIQPSDASPLTRCA